MAPRILIDYAAVTTFINRCQMTRKGHPIHVNDRINRGSNREHAFKSFCDNAPREMMAVDLAV